MPNDDLEKKCIKKTFPMAMPTKCVKTCRGYDKFCEDYIATGSFNLMEIEGMIDYEEQQKLYPQKR